MLGKHQNMIGKHQNLYKPRCPQWVNYGLSWPTPATSAFRGRADANDAKADMPAAMSAVEGRADEINWKAEVPVSMSEIGG
jgi:hypothetical protein